MNRLFNASLWDFGGIFDGQPWGEISIKSEQAEGFSEFGGCSLKII